MPEDEVVPVAAVRRTAEPKGPADSRNSKVTPLV
jgi:hypothetical protein